MALITLTEEIFEKFADSVDRRFFEQSISMKSLLEKRGHHTDLLGLNDSSGKLQIAALIYSTPMFGGNHMEVHYGPIFEDKKYLHDFLVELRAFAKQKKVMELEIKPYEVFQKFDDHGNAISEENFSITDIFKKAGFKHEGLTKGYESIDWHYIKDLSQLTEKDLIKSFSKKGKPLVKKAKTFGIKIRPLKRDELHLFKDITSSTSDRRDYNDKSLEYYEYLFDSFGEHAEFLVATLNFQEYHTNLEKDQAKLRVKLDKLEHDLEINPNSEKKQNQHKEISSQFQTFEVRKKEAKDFIEKYQNQDVILAGSVFIFTKQELVYFFSGSYTEFNKFYAPTVLQEYAMLEAIDRGIPRYNLLGVEGNFDGSDGVLGFKQNFNGFVERAPGKFTYYPNPIKHKSISFVKTILGRK
ncbi:Aminoacyltransferase FemA [Streptococcus parauberis]|uniref:Aminoacyltransferase FemA n=1 Tax=Streptococcus parauberis TaxID=1348 RepID=A0A854W619_9STRE|nr:aminoacyltransferase [Streptococcus parauberis]PCH11306.1 Aminoacyltransferase FemA [Streptococcus parauberis]